MNLVLMFRELVATLSEALAAEFDQLRVRINTWAQKDHNTDGTHRLITLNDGVTAPTVVSGKAQVYVDTSDGDLKVIFGDGTIKTIVTDT